MNARFTMPAIAILLLAGCKNEPTDAGTPVTTVAGTPLTDREGDHDGDHDRDDRGRRERVERQLAALRRATAAFHDTAAAHHAGWDAKITGCMFSAQGGMGFHYGNTGLFDGAVDVEHPELLLYEPERNGRLRLVAVEYIIPYTFHARDAEPPVLFGQRFTQNDVFQLWGLHAWVWKDNPTGIFQNWNPRVSCRHTTDVMPM